MYVALTLTGEIETEFRRQRHERDTMWRKTDLEGRRDRSASFPCFDLSGLAE
jgi:hypothetical protein